MPYHLKKSHKKNKLSTVLKSYMPSNIARVRDLDVEIVVMPLQTELEEEIFYAKLLEVLLYKSIEND